ncbi:MULTISPECIES: LysR family transcriptional regulator [unclassified Shinella]|jgi:DNA-binding transcriptional LysR family regulator|uniref:LysR family transcriptional regulator n=1 Tax=unclassified Shinella TaxID=2643062 RepID=UPI0003C560A2|nr:MULTISPECIES: LysR family transcriptional regulator [unclassified Shinella]MCA0343674.1 LysR family transcriptional regulator [Pseudomonadota bacterium]EYR82938.1 LysR family transcriptional regulator [Shinella sp. DD12]MCO5151521.1 LysR family transcriptional regulator [Shinella sp.]MDC7266128.1 LysR family transcriptional regulator [Shinella sp. HY16]MDC7273025.1 LysR family transcriptional regulator [Shinella sp. YZ44]
MGRSEVNRSGEMEIFARVVELGGFSPAARAAGMTPSAVSKLIARLEARLGARLLNRSTRQLQVTPEGCAFYERAKRILADLEDAERAAGLGEQPVGRVRINTSASYATHVLAPLLPEFLALHAGITLDIILTDAVVDLLAERTDVAVRAGPLKSSSLIARKLGETQLVVVAAPAYLSRCGEPRTIAELQAHNRLGFGYTRAVDGWPLRENGKAVIVPATGRIQASDGEALRYLALAGVGLARLSAFTVRQDIAAGRLVPVLGHLGAEEKEAFHAVYVGQGGPLPSRVRALLDFLAERGKVS